jgi:hypothetical protein
MIARWHVHDVCLTQHALARNKNNSASSIFCRTSLTTRYGRTTEGESRLSTVLIKERKDDP